MEAIKDTCKNDSDFCSSWSEINGNFLKDKELFNKLQDMYGLGTHSVIV